MSDQTTMKTNTGTLDRLRNHGKCGDSLDSVLNKVLDKIDNRLQDVEEKVADLEEEDSEEEK